jgi:hypothetical protein
MRVALAALAVSAPALADSDTASLALKVVDPPVLSFDVTGLGRATHPLRLVLSNRAAHAVKIEPLVIHYRPTRDGVTYPCDEPSGRDDRFPASLEANESFSFPQTVTCNTPLPGRYEVEMRARPRSAPTSAERSYGSFPLQIDPGSNPPVRVPWETAIYAAASGTKDMRPSNNPNAARIVIAMINATKAPFVLAPVHATLRVTRRGSSVQACPDRNVDLAFTGTLEVGRSQSLGMGLGCDISAEALYDVEVSVANASGARVRIATHGIRVTVNAPSSPSNADDRSIPFAGGSGT